MTAPESFDVVIVGSGFGGSVSAYRLASGGLSVCVLERGRSYPPNSFPRDPAGLARNLWDPSRGQYGMFDVWSFSGLEGLVSSGLGGGSLIYANVLIRKDERWFVNEDGAPGYEYWPITRADLDPHYDHVEEMLNGQTYPFDRAPYSSTAKTHAMRDAAIQLGLDWQLPKLAVTFANRGREPVPGEGIVGEPDNLHHASRTTCRLCGECDVGCNYGAKNTLDYNYLSRAQDHGAEIRTLSEVHRIDVDPRGGYLVQYVQHDPLVNADSTNARYTEVHADKLILSAGTFGSPYLLLRNRAAFPALSAALGTHFSGNGDLLTFISRTRTANGDVRPLDPSVGPVITSAIRMPDTLDGDGVQGRGFYVEDGGNPAFLNYLEEVSGASAIGWRTAAFVLKRMWAHRTGNPRSNYSQQVGAVLGDGQRSATTLPVLTMGRDVPDGVMSLRKDDLQVDWTTHNSDAYFDRVETTLARIAHALGGRIANTPLWAFKRVITVHPLGGCPMGRTREEGVVDSYGEVFGYPGLYVADGSVMPGPVGPNPSLTIAAFADRMADAILAPTYRAPSRAGALTTEATHR